MPCMTLESWTSFPLGDSKKMVPSRLKLSKMAISVVNSPWDVPCMPHLTADLDEDIFEAGPERVTQMGLTALVTTEAKTWAFGID